MRSNGRYEYFDRVKFNRDRTRSSSNRRNNSATRYMMPNEKIYRGRSSNGTFYDRSRSRGRSQSKDIDRNLSSKLRHLSDKLSTNQKIFLM